MDKESLIDQILNVTTFSGIPEHFWVGTTMQQAAARRFILTEKFVYDPEVDEKLKEYAQLTCVPLDKCVFDRSIYNFIKQGKELPRGSYYDDFKEQWKKRRK